MKKILQTRFQEKARAAAEVISRAYGGWANYYCVPWSPNPRYWVVTSDARLTREDIRRLRKIPPEGLDWDSIKQWKPDPNYPLSE